MTDRYYKFWSWSSGVIELRCNYHILQYMLKFFRLQLWSAINQKHSTEESHCCPRSSLCQSTSAVSSMTETYNHKPQSAPNKPAPAGWDQLRQIAFQQTAETPRRSDGQRRWSESRSCLNLQIWQFRHKNHHTPKSWNPARASDCLSRLPQQTSEVN